MALMSSGTQYRQDGQYTSQYASSPTDSGSSIPAKQNKVQRSLHKKTVSAFADTFYLPVFAQTGKSTLQLPSAAPEHIHSLLHPIHDAIRTEVMHISQQPILYRSLNSFNLPLQESPSSKRSERWRGMEEETSGMIRLQYEEMAG